MQDELEKILKEISTNQKALKELTKKGHLSYKGMKESEGNIAIVNNKAVLSYLKYLNKKSKAIATASLVNKGTLVYRLDGEKCDETKVGWNSKGIKELGGFSAKQEHKISKEKVSSQIDLICKYCKQAKDKSKLKNSRDIIKETVQNSTSEPEKLSEKEVLDLLKETLKSLNKCKNIENKSKSNNIDIDLNDI